MYVSRDDWAKVHELAALQGPEVAATYALKHAERRFKQGDYAQVGAPLSHLAGVRCHCSPPRG